jgi:ABC-type branched-subunit amino acid transport system substrate-binding protein
LGAMVLTGSEKAPDSFSEFYKQAREAGLIGKIQPNVSYQKIFDYFLGENAVKVEMVCRIWRFIFKEPKSLKKAKPKYYESRTTAMFP